MLRDGAVELADRGPWPNRVIQIADPDVALPANRDPPAQPDQEAPHSVLRYFSPESTISVMTLAAGSSFFATSMAA